MKSIDSRCFSLDAGFGLHKVRGTVSACGLVTWRLKTLNGKGYIADGWNEIHSAPEEFRLSVLALVSTSLEDIMPVVREQVTLALLELSEKNWP